MEMLEGLGLFTFQFTNVKNGRSRGWRPDGEAPGPRYQPMLGDGSMIHKEPPGYLPWTFYNLGINATGPIVISKPSAASIMLTSKLALG